MNVLRSRANPRVRRWQRLVRDSKARRAQARALIEGTRLVSACIAAGGAIEELLVSQSGLARKEISGLVDRAGVVLGSDPISAAMRAMRALYRASSPLPGSRFTISSQASAAPVKLPVRKRASARFR